MLIGSREIWYFLIWFCPILWSLNPLQTEREVGRVMRLETSIRKNTNSYVVAVFEMYFNYMWPHFVRCFLCYHTLMTMDWKQLSPLLWIVTFIFRLKDGWSHEKPPVNNLSRFNQCAAFITILLVKSQCSLLQKRFLYLSNEWWSVKIPPPDCRNAVFVSRVWNIIRCLSYLDSFTIYVVNVKLNFQICYITTLNVTPKDWSFCDLNCIIKDINFGEETSWFQNVYHLHVAVSLVNWCTTVWVLTGDQNAESSSSQFNASCRLFTLFV